MSNRYALSYNKDATIYGRGKVKDVPNQNIMYISCFMFSNNLNASFLRLLFVLVAQTPVTLKKLQPDAIVHSGFAMRPNLSDSRYFTCEAVGKYVLGCLLQNAKIFCLFVACDHRVEPKYGLHISGPVGSYVKVMAKYISLRLMEMSIKCLNDCTAGGSAVLK